MLTGMVLNYGVGRNGAGVILIMSGLNILKNFDMRGELTDISEAEALELIKELRE